VRRDYNAADRASSRSHRLLIVAHDGLATAGCVGRLLIAAVDSLDGAMQHIDTSGVPFRPAAWLAWQRLHPQASWCAALAYSACPTSCCTLLRCDCTTPRWHRSVHDRRLRLLGRLEHQHDCRGAAPLLGHCPLQLCLCQQPLDLTMHADIRPALQAPNGETTMIVQGPFTGCQPLDW